MNQHSLIIILWILSLGFIIYKRNQSNLIILACVLIISIILLRDEKKIDNKLPDILEQNDELIHWMDEMLNSKNDDDKHRCYNEISNMLYSDSLLKNNTSNGKLLRIIEKYRPTLPMASNIDSSDQIYSVSMGFTKN
ncbi:MAG: hypothetical protein Ct9H90mP28_5290 [Paracoccaceae bacterium]|nr:MAG: hypothetical protein Ct9H90mP28_5290 [Paracoccaceae bacterium]